MKKLLFMLFLAGNIFGMEEEVNSKYQDANQLRKNLEKILLSILMPEDIKKHDGTIENFCEGYRDAIVAEYQLNVELKRLGEKKEVSLAQLKDKKSGLNDIEFYKSQKEILILSRWACYLSFVVTLCRFGVIIDIFDKSKILKNITNNLMSALLPILILFISKCLSIKENEAATCIENMEKDTSIAEIRKDLEQLDQEIDVKKKEIAEKHEACIDYEQCILKKINIEMKEMIHGLFLFTELHKFDLAIDIMKMLFDEMKLRKEEFLLNASKILFAGDKFNEDILAEVWSLGQKLGYNLPQCLFNGEVGIRSVEYFGDKELRNQISEKIINRLSGQNKSAQNFCFYGDPGVGKTQLCCAIINTIVENSKENRKKYDEKNRSSMRNDTMEKNKNNKKEDSSAEKLEESTDEKMPFLAVYMSIQGNEIRIEDLMLAIKVLNAQRIYPFIHIDEIESILPKRVGDRTDKMQCKLMEMIEAPECHFSILGTTNFFDQLDPALFRTKRFEKIEIKFPDAQKRYDIINKVFCDLDLVERLRPETLIWVDDNMIGDMDKDGNIKPPDKLSDRDPDAIKWVLSAFLAGHSCATVNIYAQEFFNYFNEKYSIYSYLDTKKESYKRKVNNMNIIDMIVQFFFNKMDTKENESLKEKLHAKITEGKDFAKKFALECDQQDHLFPRIASTGRRGNIPIFPKIFNHSGIDPETKKPLSEE